MITDYIMEVLNRITEALEGTAYAQGVDVVVDALGDYDEDKWAGMSESEREEYIKSKIKNHITL